MAKSLPATSEKAAAAPKPFKLTPAQKLAVSKLTRELPPAKPLARGEVEGLMKESLEGYVYGERVRYDSQGREWTFRRQAVNDCWELAVYVTFYGVPLGDGAVRLDRVAALEGEHAMMARVEQLADEIGPVQDAACAEQRMLLSEAEAAIAPLVEPEPPREPEPPPPMQPPPSQPHGRRRW